MELQLLNSTAKAHDIKPNDASVAFIIGRGNSPITNRAFTEKAAAAARWIQKNTNFSIRKNQRTKVFELSLKHDRND